jgi:hypothetical protein
MVTKDFLETSRFGFAIPIYELVFAAAGGIRNQTFE